MNVVGQEILSNQFISLNDKSSNNIQLNSVQQLATGVANGFNQLVAPQAIQSGEVTHNITITKGDDYWYCYGTPDSNFEKLQAIVVDLNNTHKYYCRSLYKNSGNTSTIYTSLWANNGQVGLGHDNGEGLITTTKGYSDIRFYPWFSANGMVDAVFRPQLIDLTAMFGAGNEPSDVTEFNSLFKPELYYGYHPLSQPHVAQISYGSAGDDPLRIPCYNGINLYIIQMAVSGQPAALISAIKTGTIYSINLFNNNNLFSSVTSENNDTIVCTPNVTQRYWEYMHIW